MDLFDASNAPTPVTVDPVTGNTVSANGNDNMAEKIQMGDTEGYADEASNEENYITDNNNPTCHDFSAPPPDAKAKIVRLLRPISPFWGDLSPATPFPIQYQEDTDVHNGGFPLITALQRLADLTRSGHKHDAIYWTLRLMKERNIIDGNTMDEGRVPSKSKNDDTNNLLEDISVSMVMAGDFVVRLEDIEDSIRGMRSRVNTYRPNYQGQGRGRGRSNYRGRWGGRGGRGSGTGDFGGHSMSGVQNPLA
ncbi:hypothetical protein G6011_03788 [Alternaria panax]|uniref:Uncharacterized protein n=1 Tax=Alternaria panax TaxID=48097 RepID=A0AAD4IFZ8_9PLEO|nr:hypothetical protein G6011_03788 [Alternaria panax]